MIVDFACLSQRLVVEVDGDTHTEIRDRQRDRALAAAGFRVAHVDNNEVYENLDGVPEYILLALEDPCFPLEPPQY